MKTWLYALAFLLMSAVAPHARAQTTQGPSFSCAGAKDVDAVVCQDARLSADDRRLTALYTATRTAVIGTGSSQQQTWQRKWLKAVHTDCTAVAVAKRGLYKTSHDCIADAYTVRLGELATAALFTDHADAMAVIRETAPADAAIYEAIYQYATTDDARTRAARVVPLIAPIFAGLDADHKSAFTDNGGPATAAAAVASDNDFGTFVDVTVSELDHGISWPCAAFVRRPGTLGALGSMYGSTRDNSLPATDCDEMTAPEASGFSEFMVATLQNAPDCDGTIRFAGGREFYRMRTAALLHRPEQWAKFQMSDGGKPETTFRKRRAADIAKAQSGLAAYYVQVLHIDAATASRDAGKITDILINQAYNLCS
jgi:uncharacterized protein